MGFALAGSLLNAALVVVLAGTCAFDDGSLSSEWSECALPLAAITLPGVIAAMGMLRDRYALLLAAGISGVVVAIAFFTGPGVSLFVPAVLYLLAGAYWPDARSEVA